LFTDEDGGYIVLTLVREEGIAKRNHAVKVEVLGQKVGA
jgi:phosphatidate phosphatase APP1